MATKATKATTTTPVVLALLCLFVVGASAQADSAREDLTTYSRQCIPKCKRGHWYTLGIPSVNCVHDEELDWLANRICKEDVRLSQLMPLLPKPEECSLKHLKHWLEETCNFPFPTAKLDPSCRPRCKRGRWYTLGIPIPDCNQIEYDIWLHDFVCSVQDPVSVQTLMETADRPESCSLNDLSLYLKETCRDVDGWSPGGTGRPASSRVAASPPPPSPPRGPYVQSMADPEPQGKDSHNLPVFGATNSESMHELGLGKGKLKLPRPSFESFLGTETAAASSAPGNYQPPSLSGGGDYSQSVAEGYSPASYAPQRPPPQCALPMSAGSPQCRAVMQSYHFDTLSGACAPFIYSGCGGNANRFATLNECETVCVPQDSAPAVFELGMDTCGRVQASDGGISTVPVVLKIEGGNPNSQIAIFRAQNTKEEDPMSAVVVPDNLNCAGTGLGLGGSFSKGLDQIKAWSVSTQAMGDALFKIDNNLDADKDVCHAYVYQAVDLQTCKLSNVLDTRPQRPSFAPQTSEWADYSQMG